MGIDWSNPITRDLIFAVSGTGPDAVSGQQGVALASGKQGITKNGVAIESTSTTDGGYYYPLSKSIPNTLGDVTLFQTVEIDSWSSYSSLLCIPAAAGSWSPPYGAFGLQRVGVDNKLRLWGTDGGVWFVTSLPVYAGNSYSIGASRSGASAIFDVNGATESVSGVVGAFDLSARQPICLLQRSSSNNGEGIDGRSAITLLWKRALSADELKSIRENPWQIFAPRSSRRLISAGAGGSSTDLTVQEALHGHNADSLTFSMATYLSVAESLHGHAAESLTLGTTGSANLIVQEAAHAHIADGVTLTTQWLLAIAEALHSHAADNVALSLQTALSVLEALHGHSADNLTLGVTGATNLVIADATSGHAADNLAFSLNTLLAVFDAIHAHAADALTLDTSDATSLTVQDSTHGHGADSLTLSLDTWLAIVEATHGHTADSPTLSTSTALLIAEALHAHYADVVVLGFPSAPGSCPTVEEIVAAVLAALNATAIPVNIKQVNSITIKGAGVTGNFWGPV